MSETSSLALPLRENMPSAKEVGNESTVKSSSNEIDFENLLSLYDRNFGSNGRIRKSKAIALLGREQQISGRFFPSSSSDVKRKICSDFTNIASDDYKKNFVRLKNDVVLAIADLDNFTESMSEAEEHGSFSRSHQKTYDDKINKIVKELSKLLTFIESRPYVEAKIKEALNMVKKEAHFVLENRKISFEETVHYYSSNGLCKKDDSENYKDALISSAFSSRDLSLAKIKYENSSSDKVHNKRSQFERVKNRSRVVDDAIHDLARAASLFPIIKGNISYSSSYTNRFSSKQLALLEVVDSKISQSLNDVLEFFNECYHEMHGAVCINSDESIERLPKERADLFVQSLQSMRDDCNSILKRREDILESNDLRDVPPRVDLQALTVIYSAYIDIFSLVSKHICKNATPVIHPDLLKLKISDTNKMDPAPRKKKKKNKATVTKPQDSRFMQQSSCDGEVERKIIDSYRKYEKQLEDLSKIIAPCKENLDQTSHLKKRKLALDATRMLESMINNLQEVVKSMDENDIIQTKEVKKQDLLNLTLTLHKRQKLYDKYALSPKHDIDSGFVYLNYKKGEYFTLPRDGHSSYMTADGEGGEEIIAEMIPDTIPGLNEKMPYEPRLLHAHISSTGEVLAASVKRDADRFNTQVDRSEIGRSIFRSSMLPDQYKAIRGYLMKQS